MCAKKVTRVQGEVPTTGHSWDGIEEYDNPMPRWWVWVFYACIVWGVGYTIAYPAWPLVSQATQGLLGVKNRANVATEIESWDARNAETKAKLVSTDLNAIKDDAALAALARYRADFMDKLFRDSLGFAGCKMIRRILGLAHVEDMESIADARVRAGCELLALGFARNLVLNAASFNGIEDVVAAARHHVNATQHSQGALPNA